MDNHQVTNEESASKLSGRLRKFLWLTIGLTSLLFGILTIASCGSTLHYNTLGKCLYALSMGAFFIAALMSIICAYRQSSTAVSWATIYFIMMTLLGLSTFADISLDDVSDIFSYNIFILLIAFGGLIFVFSSGEYDIFPKEIRSRSWVAIGLLIIFAGSLAFISYDTFNRKDSVLNSKIFTTQSILKSHFREFRKELPMVIRDGLLLEDVRIVEDMLTFQYKFTQLKREDVDFSLQIDDIKQRYLDNMFTSLDDNAQNLAALVFGAGYTQNYAFYDMNSRPMCSFTISPEDYYNALSMR